MKRSNAKALRQKRLFFALTLQFFIASAFLADAQLPPSMAIAARSISGQFSVIAAQQTSPLANQLMVLTNSELVRLEPALLAVSAERIKKFLWQELGM
ncbi:MAG TPA: hypothetical protein VN516_05570, partial [Candidatus Baltobacteraceae bacterium]|nr:hypothetical protein [Candidatus Baltobacteraceae bacterium]